MNDGDLTPLEALAAQQHGESLGCPDCAAGEPHVCPFEIADRMNEPRRSVVLRHIRAALS